MKYYEPPPDKSVTIRALLLAAAAEGPVRVENPLCCADTEAALGCLTALGVRHCRDGKAILVEGRGLRGFRRPDGPLDVGESGALARLLAGLMAGQNFPTEITGRGTLMKRPMGPLAEALGKLGARVKTSRGLLPLSIRPARLKGAKVQSVDSAQVKSALLLAGLYAAGPSLITEKFCTRDHTERMLALLGARLTRTGRRISLEPGPLTARPIEVPGDLSSAAPFIAAALLSGRELRVEGCGLNPGRLGFVDALVKMGAKIDIALSPSFPEPSGSLTVKVSRLKAASFKPPEIPAMIDEVPLLAVAAAAAPGVTTISGVGALKAKESDRVASTLALLASLGVKAAYSRGALKINGVKKFRAVSPVDTFSDHRIAMAAAAASVRCSGLKILNAGCVNKSYPSFWSDLGSILGAGLHNAGHSAVSQT